MKRCQIGIIGSAGPEEYPPGSAPEEKVFQLAATTGKLLAQNNCIVITGGKGGVMEAAARGAKESGGITVGVVKGKIRGTSNSFTDVEVVSGMEGCGEETMLVLMCDGLIVIGGGAGTLQEMAIAYRNAKPLVVLGGVSGWGDKLAGSFLDDRKMVRIEQTQTPEDAVNMVLRLIANGV